MAGQRAKKLGRVFGKSGVKSTKGTRKAIHTGLKRRTKQHRQHRKAGDFTGGWW